MQIRVVGQLFGVEGLVCLLFFNLVGSLLNAGRRRHALAGIEIHDCTAAACALRKVNRLSCNINCGGRRAAQHGSGRRILLEHVGQFVGQKLGAIGIGVAILTGGKDDAVAGGVSACLDGISGCGGLGIGVDADAGEVVAKARLEEGSCSRV